MKIWKEVRDKRSLASPRREEALDIESSRKFILSEVICRVLLRHRLSDHEAIIRGTNIPGSRVCIYGQPRNDFENHGADQMYSCSKEISSTPCEK